MKTTRLISLLMVVAVTTCLTSCGNDDEEPQTLPTVTTSMSITTTATTAAVSGEITDDGNSSITEAGFVYSANVAEPEITDNKKQVTNFEELEAELTGLTSGTIYKVRAYAINKKGVGYGEIRSFETGNLAPVASDVQVIGTLEVAKTLTAAYTFTDAEGDDEDLTATGTTYQWYAADNSTGANEATINGATAKTFVVTDAQNGKVLRVKVIPKALAGTLTGAEVLSSYTTAIGAETVTFSYRNATVTYGTIIGPSGKKWLDRNLGASRVAQAVNDHLAYGDLFQWGRLDDGHQVVIRTGPDDDDATVTGTTAITSGGDVPGPTLFITAGSAGDWRTTPNHALWQGSNGTNNPCPTGWRIATTAEWVAEGIANGNDGFSKLKLTLSGKREGSDGTYQYGAFGLYWTSSRIAGPNVDGIIGAEFTYFDDASFFGADGYDPRASGLACRCIKN